MEGLTSEANEVKARIDRVGTFNDQGAPVGWSFNHLDSPHVAAIDIQDDLTIVYSGYTVAELREIAADSQEIENR